MSTGISAETRLTLLGALATALTSLALYPLFVSGGWFWTAVAVTAVVAAASALARRLSVPTALVPLIGLVALLCLLTAVYAGGEAFLRFVPTPSSLARLRDIAASGFTDINRYAAPVPLIDGITLIAVCGVGLVAVLVDLLAVSLRRAALAGLPLLALFSVAPAIRSDGVSWLAFTLGAAGFAALLMADAKDRVSRWGRPVLVRHPRAGVERTAAADTGPLTAVGRRVGLAAVTLAVAIPAILPELPAHAFFGSGGFGPGNGTRSLTTPDPIVSLKRALTQPTEQVVLRYQTDDPTPQYLRLYALDTFNGVSWSMSPLEAKPKDTVNDQTLPPPQGLEQGNVPAKRTTTRITLDRHVRDVHFLPLPYPPRRVDVKGDWRFDGSTLMVFSTRDVADGRSYEVTGLQLSPTPEQLNNALPPPERIKERYLRLPRHLPGIVERLAREATKDAHTPYEEARALQDWFTEPGRFTYSLSVPQGSSPQALRDFLTNKIGYCEQFAATMALMARSLGIPARVDVGYTAGSQTADGEWEVTTHDAHAWPELYFDGIGWLRFEPTPAAGGQATATTPSYAQPQLADIAASGTDGTSASGSDSDVPTPNSDVPPGQREALSRIDDGSGSAGASTPQQERGAVLPLGLGLGGLIVLLILGSPAAARWALRRRRWARARDEAGRAHAAWLELHDDVLDLGLPWRASDSPRAAARRLTADTALAEPAVEALTRVARAEERARYARTPAHSPGIAADSRTVRRALTVAVRRSRRWRARLLPASTLHAVSRTAARLVDGVVRVDAAWARLPRRLRRRRAAT